MAPAPRVLAVLVSGGLEAGAVRGHCTGVERGVGRVTREGVARVTEGVKGVL